jgi:tetratricopeptide (TPR) repeat protein
VDVATRIRDLRVQRGLTKTALARPRYTVSYVSQIEAGRRIPSRDAMDFFARQLGVSAQFLTTGRPDELEDELRFHLEDARRSLREGEAKRAAESAANVAARAGEFEVTPIRAEAALVRAEALAQQGKLGEAIDAFEELLEDPDLPLHERALGVVGLARAYRTEGDLAYAAQLVESFLSQTDRAPLDPSVAAELQSVLVSIYFERGDVARAERAARHALDAAAHVGSLELRAKTSWYASRVLAERRQWAEALEHATRARVYMEELDDRQSVARLHNAYAFICLEAEPPRVDEALEHLNRAEALLSGSSARGELAYVLEERGRIALLQEQPEEALRWAERSLAEASPDGLETARCWFLKGRALSAMARTDEARDALAEAARRFGAQGARQQEAGAWRELGELELAGGDSDAALEALRAGLAALDPKRTRA